MARVMSKAAGLARLRARIAALPAAARPEARAGLHQLAARAAEEVRLGLGEARASAVSVEPTDQGAVLVVDLPFAEDLEFGTARMVARPFLRPASAKAAESWAEVLAPHLVQTIKRTGR